MSHLSFGQRSVFATIPDNAIITQKIADNAVTAAKLGDNAIITQKIADNAVTAAKLGDNAVTQYQATAPSNPNVGDLWVDADDSLTELTIPIAAESIDSTDTFTFANVGINQASPLGRLHIDTGSAGTIGSIVRGASSQTANLTEWRNNSNTVLAKVDAAGNLTATSKSFDIDHPTKPDMRLRYGSLEGPEHAVYVRGRNNSNTITLPDYWTALVDHDSITVQLTGIGHNDVYVDSIVDNTIVVSAAGEYFYFVQATRVDVEPIDVEYDTL